MIHASPSVPDRFVPKRLAKSLTFSSAPRPKREKDLMEEDFNEYLWETMSTESPIPTRRGRGLLFGGSLPVACNGLEPDPFSMDTLRQVKVGHGSCHFTQLEESRMKPDFRFPEKPYVVLDAMCVHNDFYTNNIDWSTTNLIGVALGTQVYVYDPIARIHDRVFDTGDASRHVTCVAFCKITPNFLALSYRDGIGSSVNVVDTVTRRGLLQVSLRSNVYSMAWNGLTLCLGCSNGEIRHWKPMAGHNTIQTWNTCNDRVCALKWHPNKLLLASGGGDSAVRIWDSRKTFSSPIIVFREHKATTKAISWCPYRSDIIVSGGGATDKMIYVWNARSGQVLRSTNSYNQISSLEWTPTGREIISCHGFTDAKVKVWHFQTLAPIAEMETHTNRILASAVSPDGGTLATLGADEFLCLWKIGSVSKSGMQESGTMGPVWSGGLTIR